MIEQQYEDQLERERQQAADQLARERQQAEDRRRRDRQTFMKMLGVRFKAE